MLQLSQKRTVGKELPREEEVLELLNTGLLSRSCNNKEIEDWTLVREEKIVK